MAPNTRRQESLVSIKVEASHDAELDNGDSVDRYFDDEDIEAGEDDDEDDAVDGVNIIDQSEAVSEDSSPVSSTDNSSPSKDQKSTKKRKSWGQVLPEPKTCLPPRLV